MDAREHLRTAHDMFTRFGAEGFAGRAHRELQATGETVRKRSVGERLETISEVVREETPVRRIGALGGPALASDLLAGRPSVMVSGSVSMEMMKERSIFSAWIGSLAR